MVPSPVQLQNSDILPQLHKITWEFFISLYKSSTTYPISYFILALDIEGSIQTYNPSNI